MSGIPTPHSEDTRKQLRYVILASVTLMLAGGYIASQLERGLPLEAIDTEIYYVGAFGLGALLYFLVLYFRVKSQAVAMATPPPEAKTLNNAAVNMQGNVYMNHSRSIRYTINQETLLDKQYIQPSSLSPYRQSFTASNSIQHLVHPENIRAFILPKDGNNPERCEDKFARNDREYRYAVTDGVTRSFLAGSWAQIVAERFVTCPFNLKNEDQFVRWLELCSEKWYEWAKEVWIPRARMDMGEQDFEDALAEGAQTTLIGCAFSSVFMRNDGKRSAVVDVTAVGDATFFRLHPVPDQQDMYHCTAFPYTRPEDFSSTLEHALLTQPARIQRAWKHVKLTRYEVHAGDYIVLTSDALAHWILARMQENASPWITILDICTESAFKEFVQHERSLRRMEVDDTTILVIPL